MANWNSPFIMNGMVHRILSKLRAKLLLPGFAMLAFCALPVSAQVPKRDLTVELRQVGEASSGLTVSTQTGQPLLTPQQVRVRNGEKASLRLEQAMPMQWVRSVEGQSVSLAAPGVSASNRSGGVSNAVTWMDAGQSITVKPRWPGGKQPVTVEVEVRSASVDERVGADLPKQARTETVTTVTAPLGQWITIASSGSGAASGTYSSEAGTESPRLLQIRMLAP